MNIWIYGSGKYYQYYKRWIIDSSIEGIIDSDIQKKHTSIDGHYIICPDEVSLIGNSPILVLVKDYCDIVNDLKTRGVEESRIYTYNDVGSSNFPFFSRLPISIYGEIVKDEEVIICLTHNLDITGAEVALLEAVELLAQNGEKVCVVSTSDGRMREPLTVLETVA